MFDREVPARFDDPRTHRSEGLETLKRAFHQPKPAARQSWINPEYEHTFDTTSVSASNTEFGPGLALVQERYPSYAARISSGMSKFA